ncbi:MAG: ImmA/IrrE family metallo-endopeptidase [Oscillospiraceae bacterium]|nr:ImmA/IrrE family metallo-endopeptidase [Oscillospiraceae bacterium]
MTDKPRLAAVELLLKQRPGSLFFDVRKFKFDRPVRFKTYGELCRETRMTRAKLTEALRDGFMLKLEGGAASAVLYDEEVRSLRRINFTLAHELGHIYLGHGDDRAANENEANSFAAELLMPSALVREMQTRNNHPLTPEDVCAVFAISRQAAAIKLQNPKDADTEQDRRLVRRFGMLLPGECDYFVDM